MKNIEVKVRNIFLEYIVYKFNICVIGVLKREERENEDRTMVDNFLEL